jgi:protein-tyrosine phosphatase
VIENKEKTSILFVCMGNICRSPTAEGVFRKIVEDAGLSEAIHIESAGTHAYHKGEPPDRRAQAAATSRGYVLDAIRARRVAEKDYARFEYIIAMDEGNLTILRERSAPESTSNLHLFLEFSDSRENEVPDPYYGGTAGFERVLDLVEEASRGLLEHIRNR